MKYYLVSKAKFKYKLNGRYRPVQNSSYVFNRSNIGQLVVKVYPIRNRLGNVTSFEVPNWKLSRGRACRIVESIDGVKVTKRPKKILSWLREETFCEFIFGNDEYYIEEMFGDSDVYTIGSRRIVDPETMNLLINAFSAAW